MDKMQDKFHMNLSFQDDISPEKTVKSLSSKYKEFNKNINNDLDKI